MSKIFQHLMLALFILCVVPEYAHAQTDPDVETLDGIITRLYASISGEKGVERDWPGFRKLFTENAQLVPTNTDENGVSTFSSWTPEEYVERANEWLVTNGFHEVETHRVTETFGPVTHIFSTYDSRNSIKDEKPFSRGINSIQLFHDGSRWWIMSIYWAAENSSRIIPDKYLPK